VDFGCILGVEATYVDGVNSVYLYGVARVEDFLIFEFRCDDPAMASHNLVFVRKIDDPEYSIEHKDATPQAVFNTDGTITYPSVVEDRLCDTRPLWEGYLITGDLTDLADMLSASGEQWYADGKTLTIEPALVQNMKKTYLRSVSLANEARTIAVPTESCSEAGDGDSSAGTYLVNATCVDGPLVFKEGYNCRILQSTFDNSLTFFASAGAGGGEPCEEVSLTATETPPAGSKLLSGGPSCFDLLTSINGVFGSGHSPSVLSLIAGPGIRISPTEGVPHSLDIKFDLQDFTVCIAPPAASSESLGSIDGSESESSVSSSSASIPDGPDYDCGTCGERGWTWVAASGAWVANTGGPECGSCADSDHDCVETAPYWFDEGQECETGDCIDGTSLTTNCECCCCGTADIANSPFGTTWNNAWTVVTNNCDAGGTVTLPTFKAPPGTEITICCDCASSVSSASETSSESSEGTGSESSSSSEPLEESSESLSSEESCSQACDTCDSKGYYAVVTPLIADGFGGHTPGQPYTPAYGEMINGCGPCWDMCCDGYEPRKHDIWHQYPDTIADFAFNCPPTPGENAFDGAAGEVTGHIVKWYCCEDTIEQSSECSECDSDGWALWWADTTAKGYPNNITWYPVKDQRRIGGFQPEQCCPPAEPNQPNPSAQPNFTPPTGFEAPPEHVFRKECCGCDDVVVTDWKDGRAAGDYSCTCSCGWAFWWSPGGGMPSCNTEHDWSLMTSSCTTGCEPAKPCPGDTGPEILDSGGFGIDAVVLVTCCETS
tara:strand:+ start:7175 stop:9502 length:2328 start_codon:yes stop_codon:yes gene_type:complete